MNPPALWLTSHRDLLPQAGAALDVACGSGRHALWLAGQGFVTTAIDNEPAAIDRLSHEAAHRGLAIDTRVVDLESGQVVLPAQSFDVIVVVHYLHRPLFPQLLTALRPGGVLVYETFTRAQAARGKPTNPAFLLEAGELQSLVRPLQIVRSREGDFDGKMLASVIAVNARRGSRFQVPRSMFVCSVRVRGSTLGGPGSWFAPAGRAQRTLHREPSTMNRTQHTNREPGTRNLELRG